MSTILDRIRREGDAIADVAAVVLAVWQPWNGTAVPAASRTPGATLATSAAPATTDAAATRSMCAAISASAGGTIWLPSPR